MIRKTTGRRLVLLIFWAFYFLTGFNITLFASDEPKVEPTWVISWATFGFLFAITIMLFARSGKRVDTCLTREEWKQVEEVMLARIAKKKRSKAESEDDDEEEDEDE
ncbi:MAG: hypothetical protein Q4C95_01540 [Planctomycetia bacterium]|nr:hypothetical protein [Planctomycetia bacterium]